MKGDGYVFGRYDKKEPAMTGMGRPKNDKSFWRILGWGALIVAFMLAMAIAGHR